MEHLAIMRKSWGLTQKIISKEKKIESRWYVNKYSPWNKIKQGEIIYFKDSGKLVSLKAEVERVIQFENLNPERVMEILKEYGKDDGINEDRIDFYYNLFKNKRYCMLIFIKNPQQIKPFDIDKKGFGAMASWICVDDINLIKK